MSRPTPIQVIRQYAPRFGLDPAAVLAYALTQGGTSWGAVGDNGTSFGPFQAHIGGAAGNRSPQQASAWANSPQGLAQMMGMMSRAGARGRRGPEAAAYIVGPSFGRGANPQRDMANARAQYGRAASLMGAPAGAGAAPRMPAAGIPRGNGMSREQIGYSILGALQAARQARLPGQRFTSAPIRDTLLSLAQQGMIGDGASPAVSPAAGAPPSAPAPPSSLPSPGGGGVRELFYDPLGAYDEGKWIKPIGGHSDHVHVSFANPAFAVRAIQVARQMGLRASENPYVDQVDPVHTKTSYHYRAFPGKVNGRAVGMALDVSGPPDKMAAYFKWVKANTGG